jgi:hypothetical protein
MANTLLTPNIITKEALRILHQKLNFVGKTNRQYDNRFANSGGKIGTSLDVRLPNKYTTRTGATMAAQNTVNRKVTLPVATQKGVDVSFSSVELSMDIDNFSRLILDPAMAQLAASIEADAFSMYKSVPNYVGAVNGQLDFKKFQQAGAVLTQELAPVDNNRCFSMTPKSRVEFSDAVKGVFQSSDNVKEQYREGKVGRTGGFDVYENTLIPTHLTGTHAGSPLTNSATAQGISGAGNAYAATTDLITDGWTSTSLKAGDVITIDGVFAVHPETKQSTGVLKRFTVVEDESDSGGDMTVTISPAIIAGGAYQNVSNLAADNKAIVVLGTTNTAYGMDLAFHRDAFIFATADLEDVSRYGAWGAREVYDGISLRIARQYDINNDLHPCRIDVLYGYVAAYPELACRHVFQL